MGGTTKILGGKYELGEPIGSGGMGTVHAARHVDLGHRVAVKVLRESLARRPKMRTRFEREAKAVARIEHDNVCEVLDFGIDGEGLPFFVMPLLKGRTLDHELKLKGPFDVERALDIAVQTLAALEATHAAGLIHRDLKPSNIFLTTMGDRRDFVKILDFGISKRVMGQGELAATLTEQGKLVGTPFYMAPEQAKGRKDIDHRVDLYAVGLLLYEMLTGRRPITGDDIHEILTNIFFTPITPPRSLRPDLPEALEQILLRAMSRDSDDRFPSARAMSEALCHSLSVSSTPAACHGQPLDETAPDLSGELEAGPPTPFAIETPAPSTSDPQKPRRLPWALAGLIGAALVATLFVSFGSIPSSTIAPAAPEARSVHSPSASLADEAHQPEEADAGVIVPVQPSEAEAPAAADDLSPSSGDPALLAAPPSPAPARVLPPSVSASIPPALGRVERRPISRRPTPRPEPRPTAEPTPRPEPPRDDVGPVTSFGAMP
jgi:serine/threonine-protein kinase